VVTQALRAIWPKPLSKEQVLRLLADHMPNRHRVLYFGEVVTLAALTTAQIYKSLGTSASAEGIINDSSSSHPICFTVT
jgi:hypothetical protein